MNDILKKNYFKIFSVTIITLLLRYRAFDFISYDMNDYLLPWFFIIKNNGGLAALNQQVGDYGLLYQTIIAIFTYLEVNPVYLYKIFSVVFDILLAGSFSYIVVKNKLNNGTYKIHDCLASYVGILFFPTVFMNSAFWGQCDSVYTFFLLWSIWLLFEEKYNASFFMLGCAFSFKLQSILLTPLFVFLYFYKKKFSWRCFLITFFTFWSSGIIAYLYGRSIFEGISVYLYQVGEYKRMWMNVPSLWFFISDDYNKWHLIAIGLTFLILGFGFYMIISRGLQMNSFEQILEIAIFIEWTCIIFLPAMHERYTYVMDILLLMLTFLNKRYIIYAFITACVSSLTCSAFLFTGKILNSWVILIYIFAWLHYCYMLFGINDKDIIDLKKLV